MVSLWREVGELCRRICVLRASGLNADAARLESVELAEVVRRVRQLNPMPAETDAKLAALFARESERVADAGALAAILLPLLQHAAPPALPRSDTEHRPRPAAPMPKELRRAPAPARGIADFIDEMIQQERPDPGRAHP